MLLDMIDDEAVGCQQFQLPVAFHRLQRSDPGAEIGGGNFVFELGQTVVPNSAHRQTQAEIEKPFMIPQGPLDKVFDLTLAL